MNTARLRCKVGDLAIMSFSEIPDNHGKIVLVIKRADDIAGSPAWHVVSQSTPMVTICRKSGRVIRPMEASAVDYILTPICPGKPIKARRTSKTTGVPG